MGKKERGEEGGRNTRKGEREDRTAVDKKMRVEQKTRQMGQGSGKKSEREREGKIGRPRSSIESKECALLGAFTRAKRDVGEPCVPK